jgi:hypothetical protein
VNPPRFKRAWTAVEVIGSSLHSPELIAGLRFGVVAFAVGLVAGLAHRCRGSTATVAVSGLLFAAALAMALHQTLGLPAGLAWGLIALVGAGLAGRTAAGLPIVPVAMVAGAWLLMTRSGVSLDRWTQVLGGMSIVLGGWLVANFDATWRPGGLGPLLFGISVVGVYTTVPDTEPALAALGAILPLMPLSWPWPLASLGRAGAYAATGALLWVVATGGVGRGSAVVGGVACLGLLVVEPLARRLDPGRGSILECFPPGRWGAAAICALHAGMVYVAARVAGLQPTVASAAAIATVEFATALVLAVAGRRHWAA